MSVKFYICTGLFIFVVGGAVPHNSYAQNGNAAISEAFIVLAQNKSEEKRGFLGRVFNRSDKKSSAKPLFLDKMRARRSQSRGKPYDYRGRKRGYSSYSSPNLSWDDFVKERTERIASNTRYALQAGKRTALESSKASDALNKEIEDNIVKKERKTEGKKMVYDPKRARRYDPNARRDDLKAPESPGDSADRKRPRIFNTR